MKRSIYNLLCGFLAIIIAMWSLYEGLDQGSTFLALDHKSFGFLLVAWWALFPPVFFWIDWVFFCSLLSKDELDVAKHTHDLSRNIWLALIAVLAVLFNIKVGM